jgi:ectoine hydroxylase-related dioxygenase (phytanoyl-CoA dioxygenase family)
LGQEYPLTEDQISAYRRDGFIALEGVITGAELQAMRDAVAGAVEAEDREDLRPMDERSACEQLFIQKVNLWQRHEAVKPFVMARRFASIARRLAGVPAVRLWHDQGLFKKPHNGRATPWHQDVHYWPHQQMQHQLSMWLALKDATVENGCMSFVPGSQKFPDLEPIDLCEPKDLYKVAPQLKGVRARTCELKAGSCTFHHGLCFHYAGPNRSDQMREAFVVIYMPDGTTYSKLSHICTDGGGWQVGQPLTEPMFPLLGA